MKVKRAQKVGGVLLTAVLAGCASQKNGQSPDTTSAATAAAKPPPDVLFTASRG